MIFLTAILPLFYTFLEHIAEQSTVSYLRQYVAQLLGSNLLYHNANDRYIAITTKKVKYFAPFIRT